MNFGHVKIETEDISKGLAAYSTDVLHDINLGIRDVLPFADDTLCAFIGVPGRLSHSRVETLLRDQDLNAAQADKVLEVLLWYGVLGIVRENGEIACIYSVNYDMKRLRALAEGRLNADSALFMNPALWHGLAISGS